MTNKKVSIELSKEEAIVLFEFLGRINEKENLDIFEDQAEERIFWDIECILEKELSEPFCSNYQEIVKKARENVRDEKE